MKIIQVVDGYKKGDGVGNVVASMDEFFKKNGYDAQICNRQLEYEDIDSSIFGNDTVVFYHLALLADPVIKHLKCKKVLVFHNITEPDLLEGTDEEKRIWCSSGLYDAARTAEYFDAAVTFSEYSRKCLVEMGWRPENITVLPILVRFRHLSTEPSEEIVKKYRDGSINILFTGRVYPNKKHEDIIAAYAAYKKRYHADARLFLVGSISSGNYYPSLLAYAKKLGVSEDVVFTGHVPFKEYLAYFHIADVYLCMSAHEGFCIPLIEAMYFNIPIIAHASTAVPDTLAGSGVLVYSRDPETVAGTINTVVEDRAYRQEILAGQENREKQLLPETLEGQYLQALENIVDRLKSEKGSPVEKGNDACRFSLVHNLSMQLGRFSPYGRKVVVYGAGAAGMRLYKGLKNDCPEGELLLCDSHKAGAFDTEAGCRIVSPEEAVCQGKESVFIISVQDKRAMLEIVSFLIGCGVRKEQIALYDKLNHQIL
ncbi:MAG TPA: hypothetical protein DF613_07760 [Lachnospiraceae bacterium]|nr:hypothetical protein [Lachnospiraceae bacterium]